MRSQEQAWQPISRRPRFRAPTRAESGPGGGRGGCQAKVRLASAAGRALEMSRGATGWCCLVLWLPACVAVHGERRRTGGVGVGIHRAHYSGRGPRVTLGTP